MARLITVYKRHHKLTTVVERGVAKTYISYMTGGGHYPTPSRGKTAKESILRAVSAIERKTTANDLL